MCPSLRMSSVPFRWYLGATCLVMLFPTVSPISTTSTAESTTTDSLTTPGPCSYIYQYDIRLNLPDSTFVAALSDPTSERYIQLKADLVVFNEIAFAGLVSCIVQTSQYVFTDNNGIAVQYLLELNEPLSDDQVKSILSAGPDIIGEGTVDPTTILVNPTFIASTSTEAPTTTATPYVLEIFPYGPSQGDTELVCSVPFCFSPEIKIRLLHIDGIDYRRMHIGTNGYVKLGEAAFQKRQPSPWDEMFADEASRVQAASQGLGVIAPLWADNDITISADSKVYYQVYDKADRFQMTPTEEARWEVIANRTRADAINYGGTATFDPTWVLIVTWVNMLPRVHYDSATETGNTHQMILMNDGMYLRSYAEILIKNTGWDSSRNIRQAMLGYYAADATQTFQLTASQSYTANMYKLDSLEGNSGEIGKWIVILDKGSESVSYEEKCLEWATVEKYNEGATIALLYNQTRSCPCDGSTAGQDSRWALDLAQNTADSTRYCYRESSPSIQSTQECCYGDNGQGPLLTAQGEGGNFFKYHPNYDVSHAEQDVAPKSWCCSLSTTYCDLFYELRPIDRCGNYKPPIVSWSFGDPHITSMDGLEFTYNGLGEFFMVVIPGGAFCLLSRTERVLDSTGSALDATVYTAFAAKEASSDPVHVERSTDQTALHVYVNNVDKTSWFEAAPVGDVYSGDNVALIKMAANSVAMSFATTGFSVTIVLGSNGVMDSLVYTPSEYFGQTSGLLGVYNNDVSDDLTTATGNVLDPNTATESEIFYEFGESWRVSSQFGNFFYYRSGSSYLTYVNPTFVPIFTEDLLATVTAAERARIETLCNGASQCVYDTIVTSDDVVGEQTKVFNEKSVLEELALENESPLIEGSALWRVTADVSNTYTVSITDPEGDATVLYLANSPQQGATFDNTTGVFSWVPSAMTPIDLGFMGYDSRGALAADLCVTIAYCDCSGNGHCQFDRYLEDVGTGSFRLAECTCDVGWAGDHCQLDRDACATLPCWTRALCVDYTPEQEVATGAGFYCSQCDTGYFLDPSGEEFECVDVNECLLTEPVCQQTCTNFQGSYDCQCSAGYALQAGSVCADVDECLAGTSDCLQLCQNTVGGFTCSCFEGYQLASDGRTCNDILNVCNLTCSNGCNPNRPDECFCPNSFELGADSQTCEDINECSHPALNVCRYPHSCVNEFGGYRCRCKDGYILQADRLTCKACSAGTWGAGCQEVCKCGDSSTVCDVTNGCESCFPGWTGGACNVDIDECLTSACEGGHVTCVNTQGSFRCQCDTGFRSFNAKSCIEIDECESNPCLNNGQCTDALAGYACTCSSGYTGSRCETDIDECLSNPCQNGGTCVDRPDKFRCECTEDWMGNTCTEPVPVASPTTTGEPVTIPPLCTDVVRHTATTVYTYSGQFKIPDRVFDRLLVDQQTLEYRQLKNEIFPQLEKVYGCSDILPGMFVSIANIAFGPGILVFFDLNLKLKVNLNKLESVLNEAFFLGQLSFTLVPDETTFAIATPSKESSFPRWAVILTIVGGLLAIVTVVFFVLWFCGYKKAARRLLSSTDSCSETDSSGSSGFKPYTFPKPQALVWQHGPDSLLRMPPAPEDSIRGVDEERLRVIRSAVDRAPPVPSDWPRARYVYTPRRGEASRWRKPSLMGRLSGSRGKRSREDSRREERGRRERSLRLHRGPTPYQPAVLGGSARSGLFQWTQALYQPTRPQPALQPVPGPDTYNVAAPSLGAFSYTGGAFIPEGRRKNTPALHLPGGWVSVGVDMDIADS